MKTVQGNLLDMFDNGDFDVIVHGCNCYCNMNGGIAAQIAARYPEAQEADNRTECGDESKVGTVDYVWMSSWLSKWLPSVCKPKVIVNAYTQASPGRDGREEAVFLAFFALAKDNKFSRKIKIGIPAIGCGIAGLEWEEVEAIIDQIKGHMDITLVEFVPN